MVPSSHPLEPCSVWCFLASSSLLSCSCSNYQFSSISCLLLYLALPCFHIFLALAACFLQLASSLLLSSFFLLPLLFFFHILPPACFLLRCLLLLVLAACFLLSFLLPLASPLLLLLLFLLLASSLLASCFLLLPLLLFFQFHTLLLVMSSCPLLLAISPLTRSPCCRLGRRIIPSLGITHPLWGWYWRIAICVGFPSCGSLYFLIPKHAEPQRCESQPKNMASGGAQS